MCTELPPLYTKYFMGNVQYLCGSSFRMFYRHRRVVNSSFARFCLVNAITFKHTHDRVQPQLEAAYKSTAKYDRPTPILPRVFIRAQQFLLDHFRQHLVTADVVDHQTALLSLNRQAGAGVPWCKVYSSKGHALDNMDMNFLVNNYETYADNKHVPVYMVTQKVELRPVAKLTSLSFRTFVACPLEEAYAGTRLFVNFNELFYACHTQTFSVVGHSPVACGWDYIVRKLQQFPNIFSADFKQCDSSLTEPHLLLQRNFRLEFVRDKQLRRKVVRAYRNIIHTVMVMEDGSVLQKHGGNPSGHPNTIVDNTLCVLRSIIAAIYTIYPNANYSDIMSNVHFCVNGDDVIYSVSDDWVSAINPTSLHDTIATFGMEMVDSSDRGDISHHSFLSHGFVYLRGRWLPLPDYDRQCCSLMLGTTLDDVRFQLLRACNLRQACWPNEKCRDVFSRYIDFILVNYKNQLFGSVQGVSVVDIISSYKSEEWCWRLYLEPEAAVRLNLKPQKF